MRIWLRRYRRPVGAVLAALSVVFIIAALRTDPEPAVATPQWSLPQGFVAVPVTVASSDIAQTLAPGDFVNLYRLSDAGRITSGAQVLRRSGSAVVVIQVQQSDAAAVVASHADGVGVVITGSSYDE